MTEIRFVDASGDDLPPNTSTPDVIDFDVPLAGAPKKRASRAPSRKPAASATELADLIGAFSRGLAKLPNQEHWELDKQEVQSIAAPLSRVLARQGPATRFLAEHADSLLLAFSVCVVTIPRVVVSAQGRPRGEPVRQPVNDPRSAALDQLLTNDPARAGTPAPRANPHANGSGSPPGGSLDDSTADALRAAFRDIPQ